MKNAQIRVATEFRDLINHIRAKELYNNGKVLSCEEITRVLVKYIDKEKVWQNEYANK